MISVTGQSYKNELKLTNAVALFHLLAVIVGVGSVYALFILKYLPWCAFTHFVLSLLILLIFYDLEAKDIR